MAKPLRVLFVDDSEDDVLLLLRELRRGGWEPEHVRVDNSAGMMAALDAYGWEVVISDFSMPLFGGFDALALLRKRDVDLPFILVSGQVDEQTAVEAVKAGANDYLFKGNLKRLGPAVERELRDAQRRREAHQTRNELNKRDQQLAEAQRLARLGTWHVNFKTRAVIWSEEMGSFLNRPPGEAAPTFDDFLLCFHPTDRAVLSGAAQSRQSDQFAHDLRIVRPGGQMRFVHIRGKIVRAKDGAAAECSGMIQDITERKLAEEELDRHRLHLENLVSERTAELQNSNQQLEAQIEERKRVESQMVFSEKMASLGQLVAGIAHEINNPLSFVINNIATLQRDATAIGQLLQLYQQADIALAGCEELRKPIEAMKARIDLKRTIQGQSDALLASRDGLDRIRRIVTGLREFVRLDADDLSTVDLNAGISSTVNMLRHKAIDEKIQLDLDLGTLPMVACYPAKINQVVMNLVSNAIDVSDPGGKVVVRSAAESDGVRIDVIDHGHGIDPAVRGKIFDPFFTTKPPGKGTGLGLSISYGIVRDHGGRIDCESEVGKGSRFMVWLPMQAAKAEAR